MKRLGEGTINCEDFLLYYNSINNKRRSVGFIINKKWSPRITLLKSISDRVTILVLKVNNNEYIGIIQAYAPTTKATEKEMEVFYDDVKKAQVDIKRSNWKIVMGYFNSKIGSRSSHESDVLGPFGHGKRKRETTDKIL